MKAIEVKTKSVLVTGCSSGIGEATALYLQKAGWDVLPTARKPEDLDRLREWGFDPIELDLGDEASVEHAVSECLSRTGGGLGGVVNNAGVAVPGAVEDLTRDALRRQFEVNVFGLQQLTNGLIPKLREQGWGRIVNVSSIYGLIAAPMVGSYCSSKFALEALSDCMRVELAPAGITVCLIEPGPIVTRFRKNAVTALEEQVLSNDPRYAEAYKKEADRRKKQNKKPDFFNRPPEEVAEKIAHALESKNPRRRYRVAPSAHLGAFLSKAAPTALLDRIMSRQVPQ
jgi:NAD(P)-dependent dehydrogenase (short-subunit alcohol dehydrogenase family)